MKVQSLLGHEDWIRGTNFALEGLLIYFLFTKCLESYDYNTHILLEFPACKFIFTVNGLNAGEAFDGVNTSHSIFRFLGRLHYTIIRITL